MPSGVLLLDKPLGLSSNAALQRVRTLFEREKAGHVGSLDPLASGMLPICLGEATKVAGDILSGRKCYRFTLALGRATATGDAEGHSTGTAAVPELEAAAVQQLLRGFLGVRSQVPPMYSAIKHGGERLYKLARAGAEVPRAPRRIELFELALLKLGAGSLELQTLCSKGTYIRVLAVDIAHSLGTLGYVSALRRLYVEPFAAEPMHTLEPLQAAQARGETPQLLRVDWPLAHLPAVSLDPQEVQRLLKGQRIVTGLSGALPRVRIYGASGEFLGLGETDVAGVLQPRRLIGRC